MAMDWESWWTLEHLVVERIGNGTGPLDADLDACRRAVERTRSWSPGDGLLTDRVHRAFDAGGGDARRDGGGDVLAAIRASVPADLLDAIPAAAGPPAPAMRAHRRFLTAHAFANWTPYLALDLRAWMRSVDAAHALVSRGWSFGQVDLILRHLADPARLAAAWSVEA
jgi:hypothetical protein